MNYTESMWNGFRRIDFTFEDREAILVFPNEENKTSKWMLKTEYFGAFPSLEIDMIKEGYHLAYIKNRTRLATEDDMLLKRKFADFLHEEFGLYRKCVCIGMSYGGYHAVAFASRFPSYVSLLYLDAPLLSFFGITDGFADEENFHLEQMRAFGYTSMSQLYVDSDQPIHRLKVLTDNMLPVALVYGDADHVVDYRKNSVVVFDYYNLKGAPIGIWCKPGCDHHPHGPVDNAEVIDFIKKHEL